MLRTLALALAVASVAGRRDIQGDATEFQAAKGSRLNGHWEEPFDLAAVGRELSDPSEAQGDMGSGSGSGDMGSGSGDMGSGSGSGMTGAPTATPTAAPTDSPTNAVSYVLQVVAKLAGEVNCTQELIEGFCKTVRNESNVPETTRCDVTCKLVDASSPGRRLAEAQDTEVTTALTFDDQVTADTAQTTFKSNIPDATTFTTALQANAVTVTVTSFSATVEERTVNAPPSAPPMAVDPKCDGGCVAGAVIGSLLAVALIVFICVKLNAGSIGGSSGASSSSSQFASVAGGAGGQTENA